jgi:hypothetical protein
VAEREKKSRASLGSGVQSAKLVSEKSHPGPHFVAEREKAVAGFAVHGHDALLEVDALRKSRSRGYEFAPFEFGKS